VEEEQLQGVVARAQAAVNDMREGKQGTKGVREEQKERLLQQEQEQAAQQQVGEAQQEGGAAVEPTAAAMPEGEVAAQGGRYSLRAR